MGIDVYSENILATFVFRNGIFTVYTITPFASLHTPGTPSPIETTSSCEMLQSDINLTVVSAIHFVIDMSSISESTGYDTFFIKVPSSLTSP